MVLCVAAAAEEPTPAAAPATVPTIATPPPSTEPSASALPSPAEQLEEVIVQTTEPRYVSPTRRDRIGRIWAPVLIDGKGPYRLVLDTGANRSAITTRAAQSLGSTPLATTTLVTGFTGSAVVPTLHVSSMEVGDLLIGPTDLPVLTDVFGGAQGVLGIEGLANKRIYADFSHDRLEIARSHGDRAKRDFIVVPLTQTENGLLVADVHVGPVRAKAIIDTGAQGTVGNVALRAHITFGDMYLFQHWKLTEEPTLTVGMDLLGSFDVLIIDYNRRELQIRSRQAPSSPYSLHY